MFSLRRCRAMHGEIGGVNRPSVAQSVAPLRLDSRKIHRGNDSSRCNPSRAERGDHINLGRRPEHLHRARNFTSDLAVEPQDLLALVDEEVRVPRWYGIKRTDFMQILCNKDASPGNNSGSCCSGFTLVIEECSQWVQLFGERSLSGGSIPHLRIELFSWGDMTFIGRQHRASSKGGRASERQS